MNRTHRPSQRCTRRCHSNHPYERNHGQINVYPAEPRRYPLRPLGIGIVIVVLGLLISSAFNDDPEPACTTPPSNAYRSNGWWYSGETMLQPVDPYAPDCFKP
jgi:hypothetical protein